MPMCRPYPWRRTYAPNGMYSGERRFDLDRLALAGADFTGRDFAALDPRGIASIRCSMAGKKPSRLLVILRRRRRRSSQ